MIFPNFDQPDCKAYLDLSLTYPAEWVTISNENPTTAPVTNAETSFVKFPRTKRISSYLFAICAGPFKEIRGRNLYRDIPQSLFCRESLYVHLQKWSDFIFEVTNESMEFL